jgi:CRP-like cAMP-binding protein
MEKVMTVQHINGIRLNSLSFFANLPDETLAAIKEVASTHILQPGEILYQQGDAADSFYVVLEGGVRLVEQTDTAKEVGLKIYGKGDLFGVLAIRGPYPHPSRVEALLDTTVIGIRGEDARKLILRHSELGLNIIDAMIVHVHHAHERIRELASEPVNRRLARALLKLCDKFGVDGPDCIHIDMPVTQYDLALFVNTTVETVNRTLQQWSKEGIVDTSRMHINIVNAGALLDIAENR